MLIIQNPFNTIYRLHSYDVLVCEKQRLANVNGLRFFQPLIRESDACQKYFTSELLKRLRLAPAVKAIGESK